MPFHRFSLGTRTSALKYFRKEPAGRAWRLLEREAGLEPATPSFGNQIRYTRRGKAKPRFARWAGRTENRNRAETCTMIWAGNTCMRDRARFRIYFEAIFGIFDTFPRLFPLIFPITSHFHRCAGSFQDIRADICRYPLDCEGIRRVLTHIRTELLAIRPNWRYIMRDEVAEQLVSNGRERAARRVRPETMRVPGDLPSPS